MSQLNSLYLPEEIWNHIFDKLDEHNLEHVSLVCKEFLSYTNPLKKSLKIFVETLPLLPGILRRFQHLEKITNYATSHNAYVLRQVSDSGSYPIRRKNLKSLSFGKYCYSNSSDLTAIADLFPWLEEIVIPCPAESHEFQYFQLKLLDLKKISFQRVISRNKSVISLSFNWANLEEIDMGKCYKVISEETIGYIMRHCPKVTSLKLPYFHQAPPNSDFSIQNSITYAKNLEQLSFHQGCMTKDHIFSFVEAKPPLKKLKINGQMRIEYLMMFFQTCSSIQYLELTDCGLPSDRSVEEISEYLPRLTDIYLRLCLKLSIASFFALIKNCPLLQGIELSCINTEAGEVSSTYLHKRESLCHLDMLYNNYLDDKTLIKVLWVFPNLRSINLSCCYQITGEAVQQIMKTCVSLTELKIICLRNVSDIFGEDFEGRTISLKNLEAGCTGIGDDALCKIGKICTSLEFLSIRGCKGATETGVMEVLRNCKKLKKLNLKGCRNLSIKLLANLVSKSCIKRIVLPDYIHPSEKEIIEFIRNNGCKICDYLDEEFTWRYHLL